MFGNEKALGKLVTVNNENKVYQVSAVIEEPHHTCSGFDAVIPYQTELPLTSNSIQSPVDFVDQSAILFIRLKNPITLDFQEKVESLLDRFFKKSDRQALAFNLSFQPVNEIFLGPEYRGGVPERETRPMCMPSRLLEFCYLLLQVSTMLIFLLPSLVVVHVRQVYVKYWEPGDTS